MNKYPAEVTVNMPTKSVPACSKHALQMLGLARAMGWNATTVDAPLDAECVNCRNEAINSEGK